MLRLTVTQMRILVVAVNLAATALVGALPIYRYLNAHEGIEEVKVARLLKNEAKDYELGEVSRVPTGNLVVKVAGFAETLRPLKLIEVEPPPAGQEENPEEVGTVESPSAEYEPGPLEEEWEYVTGFFFADAPEKNMALVRKKSSSPSTTRRITTSSIRRRVTTSRTSTSRTAPLARPTNSKLLEVYEHWTVDEDSGPAIYVDRITPDYLVYTVQGIYDKQYALQLEEKEMIYKVTENGGFDVAVPTEDEAGAPGQAGGGEEEPKEPQIFIGPPPPTRKAEYLNRKKSHPEEFTGAPKNGAPGATSSTPAARSSPTAGTRTSRYTPSSSRITRPGTSGSTAGRYQPTAREVNELKKTVNSLPPKAQEELRKGLGAAAKSTTK